MKNLFLVLVTLLVCACGAGGVQQNRDPYADDVIAQHKREIAERDRKIAEQEEKLREANGIVEAVDEYLQEERGVSVNDIPRKSEETEERPPEKPAANPQDPFGVGAHAMAVAQQQRMASFVDARTAGSVGSWASYITRNPMRGSCQGKCVRVENRTRRKEDIAILVNGNFQTIFREFRPVVGQAMVELADGTTIPGFVSLLPSGETTEWKMEQKGTYDITVVGYSRRADGWLESIGYTTFRDVVLPSRLEFGKEIPVRGFAHRT